MSSRSTYLVILLPRSMSLIATWTLEASTRCYHKLSKRTAAFEHCNICTGCMCGMPHAQHRRHSGATNPQCQHAARVTYLLVRGAVHRKSHSAIAAGVDVPVLSESQQSVSAACLATKTCCSSGSSSLGLALFTFLLCTCERFYL